MSLGCGVKAAAFTDVTASAAAQRTDFIVNTAMILKTTITMAQKPNIPTYHYAQYILNGRRLHLVRGCGGMSSAKVSKLSTILSSLYLFSNMTWFSPSGRCRPNLSRLLPRSKFILDLLRRFRAVQVTTAWSAPMHSLAWYFVSTCECTSSCKGSIQVSATAATLSLVQQFCGSLSWILAD